MPQEVQLALGRIFGMMQRPYREGDELEFSRCRSIVLDAADAIGMDYSDKRPCYSQDYGKGAGGQW